MVKNLRKINAKHNIKRVELEKGTDIVSAKGGGRGKESSDKTNGSPERKKSSYAKGCLLPFCTVARADGIWGHFCVEASGSEGSMCGRNDRIFEMLLQLCNLVSHSSPVMQQAPQNPTSAPMLKTPWPKQQAKQAKDATR